MGCGISTARGKGTSLAGAVSTPAPIGLTVDAAAHTPLPVTRKDDAPAPSATSGDKKSVAVYMPVIVAPLAVEQSVNVPNSPILPGDEGADDERTRKRHEKLKTKGKAHVSILVGPDGSQLLLHGGDGQMLSSPSRRSRRWFV